MAQRRITDVGALQSMYSGRHDDKGIVTGQRPTAEYLNELLQQTWLELSNQREVDSHVEALLDDTHDIGLPDVGLESEEVRGGWGMELVLRIRQWWPKPPTIRVPTMAAGDDPEDFANDLEEGLNALIGVQSKAQRGPAGRFFNEVKTDVIAFGRGFGAVLPTPRLAGEYTPPDESERRDPERARAYMKRLEEYGRGRLPPLSLRHLPARRVYPLFDDDGLAEVFWSSSERVWTVLERAKARGAPIGRLKDWLNRSDRLRNAEMVTMVHYANRNWIAEMVGTPRSWPPDEQNVEWLEDVELVGEPYRHWLPNRVPVAYFPGMTTPLSAYHKRTVSAVYQLRNIILMLDRLASMKATAVRVWAWPTPILKTSLQQANLIVAGADGRPRPIELSPGLMVTLWPDEDVSFLAWQGNGPEQDELFTMLRQQFDRLGLPAVESGQGDLSGYAIAQMRQAARGKWSAIEAGLIQGWEDLAWIELGYMASMPHTIWIPSVADVGWQGLGRYRDERTQERGAYLRIDPEQLQRRSFLLDVRLEPDRSLDMVANGQAGLTFLNLGIPKQIIQSELLGFENTTLLRHMKRYEELMETPEYKQVVFGAALRDARLVLEAGAEGAESGEATVEELMEFSPGQLEALAAAGLVPRAVVDQALAVQQQNSAAGQAQRLLPPTEFGPAEAPGGAPGLSALLGGPPPVGVPPANAAGLVSPGGVPSAAPAAPPAPRPPGRGRAAGQSRQPPYR